MILVNLSGGIDSTYLLWRYLCDGVDVLVHHCSMENSEHRAAAEDQAVDRIVRHLRAKGHDFELVTTAMDVSALRRLTDPQVLGFLTGLIGRQHPDLEVALGYSASDRPAQDRDLEWAAKGRQIAELVAGREITWLWPLAEITKPQIIAALPPELLALTWSCRHPRNGRQGRPCGRCLTCKRLAKERREAGV